MVRDNTNYEIRYKKNRIKNDKISRNDEYIGESSMNGTYNYTNNNNDDTYYYRQKYRSQQRLQKQSEEYYDRSKMHRYKENTKYHADTAYKRASGTYISQTNSDIPNEKQRIDLKWKDEEGNPVICIGDILHNRYEVLGLAGKGTFGTVVDVYDHKYNRRMALKVVRAVERYVEAAQIEVEILDRLFKNDLLGESFIVRLYNDFDCKIGKNIHKCIGFEKLGRSLYDFIRANHYRGFRLADVRDFGFQQLLAQAYCHSNGQVHTDQKPENILQVHSSYVESVYGLPDQVKESQRRNYEISLKNSNNNKSNQCDICYKVQNETIIDQEVLKAHKPNCSNCTNPAFNKNTYRIPKYSSIKLIDFGGATFHDQYHSTTLGTRQYCSPEVVQQVGWSYATDIWSVGCILAELFTGDLLFDTHNDLEHLALIEHVLYENIPTYLCKSAIKLHSIVSSDCNDSKENANDITTSTRKRNHSTMRVQDLVDSSTYNIRWPENCTDSKIIEKIPTVPTLVKVVFEGYDERKRKQIPLEVQLHHEINKDILPSNTSHRYKYDTITNNNETQNYNDINEITHDINQYEDVFKNPDNIYTTYPTLSELTMFFNLLRSILVIDPKRRPMASQLLLHPFFDSCRNKISPPPFLQQRDLPQHPLPAYEQYS